MTLLRQWLKPGVYGSEPASAVRALLCGSQKMVRNIYESLGCASICMQGSVAEVAVVTGQLSQRMRAHFCMCVSLPWHRERAAKKVEVPQHMYCMLMQYCCTLRCTHSLLSAGQLRGRTRIARTFVLHSCPGRFELSWFLCLREEEAALSYGYFSADSAPMLIRVHPRTPQSQRGSTVSLASAFWLHHLLAFTPFYALLQILLGLGP